MTSLSLHRADDVLILTLRRPESLHALDEDLVDALLAVCSGPPAGVRALVLTGEGDRSFCAGADLKRITALGPAPLEEFLRKTSRLFRALAELPLATVAAVNGHAHGAGAEIACACDLRVGCEGASFRFPGVRYGLAVGTWHLAGLVGVGTAKDLLLTARTVEATEAREIGLLQRLVPRERLLDEATTLAAEIAARPPDAVAAIKELLSRGFDGSLAERMDRETHSKRDAASRARAQELMSGSLRPRSSTE